MPSAASSTSPGTPSSPASTFRTRISSVYVVSGMITVLWLSPVYGSRRLKAAIDGIV